MCGWVKLYRDVLETELWKEVVPFRLYMLLLIQACREDGRMVGGMRAVRQGVFEAGGRSWLPGRRRGEKQYSKSTIKRAADKLVKKGLIATEELSIGTLFTVLRYEDIQTGGLRDFFCPPFRGTVPQQAENLNETIPQQYQEREKLEKKKIDDDRALPIESLVEQDPAGKNARISAIGEQFIYLRNRGTALSAKDKNALEKVAGLDIPLEKLLEWMKEIHLGDAGHSPLGTINSMAYYEAAIVTRMLKGKAKNKKGTESLKERMERLEMQGKLT